MKPITTKEQRFCKSCNKPLKPDMRIDAKYCDEQCRSQVHNAKRGMVHPDVKKINKVLLKNSTILEKALGKETWIKRKSSAIAAKGFDFDYITQTYKDYRFVYRYGYQVKDDGTMAIFKGYDSVVLKEI